MRNVKENEREISQDADTKRVPPAEKISLELAEGYLVRGRWRVVRKLGQGAFGAVYQVTDCTDKTRTTMAALKIEQSEGKNQVIAQETTILRKLRQGGARHATKFIASGRTADRTLNYMIMGMVGRNLGAIKRSCRTQKMSPSSTVRLGKQAFEAIWEIHLVGYLHRDVKPSNFALGCRPQDDTLLYLFDFGLSRKYADMNSERGFSLRPARDKAGFRGTVRYSSLTTHYGQELTRADDLISCMYMLVELFTGRLPWRGITDKNQVKTLKERATPENLTRGCPEEFEALMTRLKVLRYEDTPPYRDLLDKFDRIMERKGYVDNGPFPEYRLTQPNQPLTSEALSSAIIPLNRPSDPIRPFGASVFVNYEKILPGKVGRDEVPQRKQRSRFELPESGEDLTQWEAIEKQQNWTDRENLDTDTNKTDKTLTKNQLLGLTRNSASTLGSTIVYSPEEADLRSTKDKKEGKKPSKDPFPFYP